MAAFSVWKKGAASWTWRANSLGLLDWYRHLPDFDWALIPRCDCGQRRRKRQIALFIADDFQVCPVYLCTIASNAL